MKLALWGIFSTVSFLFAEWFLVYTGVKEIPEYAEKLTFWVFLVYAIFTMPRREFTFKETW